MTAHLEVPGEMFALGLQAQREDRGVVGSTSNILGFILRKVDDAIIANRDTTCTFVLGTEAGMITPIVRQVQAKLKEHAKKGGAEIVAEVVFPVASEAIAQAPESELAVLPGVAVGEGCSTAGGCATCPYMKMNSLGGLIALLKEVGKTEPRKLVPFEPKKYTEQIRGRTAADLGGEPILHMRAFQQNKSLSDALIEDIVSRNAQKNSLIRLPTLFLPLVLDV